MINEPMHDFSQAPQREKFAQAVAKVKVPAVARTVDADGAQKAIATAAAAFPAWRNRDPLDRSRLILKAAALMRDRRDELSAVMIREAGKPWREADADTCEAIDFCEYYARRGRRPVPAQAVGRVRRRVEPRLAPAARRGLRSSAPGTFPWPSAAA